MARFKSLADQADSQEAICDYMYYREENKYMHRARVLISSCGKNQYNRILNIIPEISTNDAHVYIEGDAQFEIADSRTVAEAMEDVKALGMQVVMSDYIDVLYEEK